VDNVDAVRQKNDLSDATEPMLQAHRHVTQPLLSSELGFASHGGLQLTQALANDLFRVLIAFSLVFELQAGPLIGVQGLGIGPSEATIRRGLWRKQGTAGATHLCLRICRR
jgi:hypothetical protein